MKSDKLLQIVGEAKEIYVLSALDSRNGKKRPQRQLAISRTLLIAALIAMMLLLVGCAVIYALSLQDMKVGEFTHTIPRHLDENGNKVYETEVTKDILSLQGYVGTPGYLAYQEWNSFKGTHDAPENEPEIPMENRLDYLSYGCLSQKEIDKVDEICEKYNLHKLGIAWMEESPEITFDALGIDGLVLPKTPAEVHYYQGYYYWDGTFDIPFELTLTAENSLWKHPMDMRMRYVMKTAFDSVGVEVDSVENYKEWTYTTRQGVKVLLALSDNGALMIADRTDAFLTVLVSNTTIGEDRLSQKGLEAVAEVINFGVDPGVVDVEAAQARYDDGLERAREAQKAEQETSPFMLESYRQYVDYVVGKTQNPQSLMYGRSPDEFFYCIRDFNGDGIEDFLWGSGGDKFTEVVTLEDGKIKLLYNVGMESYLCENNVIEQSFDRADCPTGSYRYVKFENGMVTEELCHLQFDREAGTWTKATYDEWGSWETISEEEAMSLIHSYKRLELDMRPITEFEMK